MSDPPRTPVLPARGSLTPGATVSEWCPWCGDTAGVRRTASASRNLHAWSCADCDTSWAITDPRSRPAHLADLAASIAEITRLRQVSRRVRDRLLAPCGDENPGRPPVGSRPTTVPAH